jgi:catechol 2,3-dioxygenase-like lactoylglutathione lyase family enzyme
MDIHVYIEVTDLDQGVDFYRNALGLRVRRQLDSDWVELQGASVPVFLLSDRPAVAELGGRRVDRDFASACRPQKWALATGLQDNRRRRSLREEARELRPRESMALADSTRRFRDRDFEDKLGNINRDRGRHGTSS